jgi:pimeloyl-ACP methyl ester carboxylesterase
MFNNRWHHGFHWELDFPEALTAGREDIYLGFFYRNWGRGQTQSRLRPSRSTPVPIACRERCGGLQRLPCHTARRGRQRGVPESGGKLQRPVLCFGGPLGRGREMAAIEAWRRVAEDVRGGIAEGCGHWIPEERPDW